MGRPGHGAAHILQQQAVAGCVVIQPAVPGGVDPRRAVQRVHAQAAVIGDGRQTAGLHDSLGLDAGILGEGCTVLLRLKVQTQIRLEHHLHTQLT